MAFSWKNIRRTKDEKTISGPRRAFGMSAGVLVNEDTASKVAAYYRGFVYISTQIAKLPWEVKDRDNNILEGPISNLLNLAPNPNINAFYFRLFAIQQAIHHGNFYAEIERNTLGTPVNLWPLKTNLVEPLLTDSGNLVYAIQGGGKNGETVYLPSQDVFHIRNLHTKNGIIGEGIIAYAMDAIGISAGADRMASGLFANSGIPSGILTHPGKLSDEAYLRLKQSWIEQQSGRKSASVAILEEGIEWKTLNMEPTLLQFLDSRKFGVIEIGRFLGLPPTKLFDNSAATYNNVENANLEVATDTLDTWAVNLEMEADVKLLNYRFGGKFTELDLYSVFRGDMKTRADYFTKMMQSAAITPNQIRRREGLPPGGPEGDRYYIANNNFAPIDRIDEIVDAQVKKGDAQATGAQGQQQKQENQNLTNAIIDYLKK